MCEFHDELPSILSGGAAVRPALDSLSCSDTATLSLSGGRDILETMQNGM
jgi:hypothetical protein